MDAREFLNLARRLMSHPAVACHEHAVRAEAQAICAEHGLSCEVDRFGNLLVRLRTAPGLRPLLFSAHLDHPGFEILRELGPGRWLARFRGGVPEEYFRPATPLMLMPGRCPARLGAARDEPKHYEIISSRALKRPPGFAVWRLPEFSARGSRIIGRACDDLIGVACTLAALIDLKRQRAKVNVIGAITRAEEVGFYGALALAASEVLPRRTLVVSLETSKQLPGVIMGQGVIIRVGDKASVFDSEATRFLGEVAAEHKEADPRFVFQRALMGGGTCEATAYQEYGFQSAALCVALGNYHNCGPANRIRAEYVSQKDALGMVDLLVRAATAMPRFKNLAGKLPTRLKRLLREAHRDLPRTGC